MFVSIVLYTDAIILTILKYLQMLFKFLQNTVEA